MTMPVEMLRVLCPLHAVVRRNGQIAQTGPTLRKICGGKDPSGMDFFAIFEVYRPRFISSMEQLLRAEGRKLHLRLRGSRRVGLKGVVVGDGSGGAIVNLSFGIGVIDTVRDFDLTATDFAPTDLAIEMLYLVEAKSAAMDASRRLNTRLQGAKLAAEERAFTDTLTGLGNRRAMDKALERALSRDQGIALMHMDLDFFKQVNDRLGHAAGDHVLQAVAHIMSEATRKDDTVARVGGDEFVIICPGLTSEERLSAMARNLIDRIERPVHYQNQTCEISASIGIAIVPGGIRAEGEQLLEAADSALYAAKRAGRAQYRFAKGLALQGPADGPGPDPVAAAQKGAGEKTSNTPEE